MTLHCKLHEFTLSTAFFSRLNSYRQHCKRIPIAEGRLPFFHEKTSFPNQKKRTVRHEKRVKALLLLFFGSATHPLLFAILTKNGNFSSISAYSRCQDCEKLFTLFCKKSFQIKKIKHSVFLLVSAKQEEYGIWRRLTFLKKEFALKRYNQLPYLDFNSNKQILKVNK